MAPFCGLPHRPGACSPIRRRDSPDGRVEAITPEQAETHNKLLSEVLITGLDTNCEVGQGGTFYYSPAKGVTTWVGTLVSNNVTVNLGATYPTVHVYDPTLGTSATETLTNVASVSLTLGNYPLVLEIPPSVLIQRAGTNLQVLWPRGALLVSTNLIGPWSTNTAPPPDVVTPTKAQEFYRAR